MLLFFLSFKSVKAIEWYFSSFSGILNKKLKGKKKDILPSANAILCITTKEPLRNELEKVA